MKLKKATQLAALAAASPLLLFAGRTLSTAAVQTASYKLHKCTACSTEIAFGAPVDGVTPFCPACGSGMAATGGDVQVLPQEEQLTSVGCPTCSTHNVVEDRTADVLGGKMSCTACGTPISYMASAVADEEDGDDETEGDELNLDSVTADTSEEHDDAADTENDGEEGDKADRETETADAASDAASAVADGAAAAADAARRASEDGDALDLDSGSEMAADEAIDVDLTDAVDEDGEVEVKLDDSGEEARLLAFVDGVHTMTLVKANAGDNADLLVQTSFHQALQRETAKHGFRALANYGFQPVKVKVQIAKLVDKRVQAAMAADKARVEAKLGDLNADYTQCLQLAAAALTHNFYRNRPNPLLTRLVASLESAGVRQGRKLVTAAMLAAGPEFATQLLELSEELMDKSVETRNELSDTLSQMNPAATADFGDEEDDVADQDDSEQEFASIHDRLTAGVTPVRQSQVVVASARNAHTSMGAELRALKQHTR